MKLSYLALCTICCTPLVFAEGGQEKKQQQKRFGTGLPAYIAQYDVDGDGVICEEERQVMEQARDQIRKQLRSDWDVNGDGVISDQERDQARTRLRDMITECRTARFVEADISGDGALDRVEFGQLPGMVNKTEEFVDAIFDRLDTSGNDLVEQQEFLDAVQKCDRVRDGSCK